jgi:tetraacyldisaccharide 4'-kinase
LIRALWHGDSVASRIGRVALSPAEAAYAAVMRAREALFARGVLDVHESPVGVVSVGNLTVGGTGKTPVTAWIAQRLVALGRRPSIVLRGYGGDETHVHAKINPGVPVIADSDRVRGIARAAADGADCVVLDDAFQHRRAFRDIDLVLVSADEWTPGVRLLPAGPYRESPAALARATAVAITVKAASDDQVRRVMEWIHELVPDKPVSVINLVQYDLQRADGSSEVLPVSALSRKRVVAIAAIGNPGAFFRQIEATGASVIPVRFPDHHAFTQVDATRAAGLARASDYVVCTLKDAVKLASLWPATAAPLWYVSQAVEVEVGEPILDGMLRRLPGRRA